MENKTALIIIEECFKNLNLAIEVFQNFLSARTSSDTTDHYQGLSYLDKGKTLYKDSLGEISKIIGFVPTDASPAFRQWKAGYLEKIGILSRNTEFERLRSELQNDDLLLKFLTAEEINILLVKHFESQQTGKRKLEYMKARMLFDKLQSLIEDAESLSIRSKERIYQQR